MLSIFVMYSNDREDALFYTRNCLEEMELYSECQKILVVDGQCDLNLPDWLIVEVSRNDGKFCWANMWNSGVGAAHFDKIVYLDCDRLLPKSYLRLVNDCLEDDTFVFTSMHFNLLEFLSPELCYEVLKGSKGRFLENEISGKIQYEPRAIWPVHGAGKNVMSGSTAFTKSTYRRLGGVDPWYCGHGAFADSDFHMTAYRAGCKFVDLGLTELHLPHYKLTQNGDPISWQKLWKLSLRNFIYYCWKWDLNISLAEEMAEKSGIDYGYVYQTALEIAEAFGAGG